MLRTHIDGCCPIEIHCKPHMGFFKFHWKDKADNLFSLAQYYYWVYVTQNIIISICNQRKVINEGFFLVISLRNLVCILRWQPISLPPRHILSVPWPQAACCSVAMSCLTVTPWTAAHQASLAFTISRSLPKLICFDTSGQWLLSGQHRGQPSVSLGKETGKEGNGLCYRLYVCVSSKSMCWNPPSVWRY